MFTDTDIERERDRETERERADMEDEIVPLGNNVAERTPVIRLTERHTAVHTPTHTQLGHWVSRTRSLAPCQLGLHWVHSHHWFADSDLVTFFLSIQQIHFGSFSSLKANTHDPYIWPVHTVSKMHPYIRTVVVTCVRESQ